MQHLSIKHIIDKINQQETFTAVVKNNSFLISIEEYVPYVCASIHNGGNLRNSLRQKIILDKFERWYEEDPLTNLFLSSNPIRLIAYDSRFEYDLNRRESECLYETAWGKEVWKVPLTKSEKELSLEKHRQFYQVLHCLIQNLNSIFGHVLVYDFHSYNYKRHTDRETPDFNIGTERIDHKKYRGVIDNWLRELGKIKFSKSGKRINVKENSIFYGRGFFLEYITTNFQNTVVLATELKKTYCDEYSGNEDPYKIGLLVQGIQSAIQNNVTYFQETFLSKSLDLNFSLNKTPHLKSLIEIDQHFYDIAKNIDFISLITPNNIKQIEKEFQFNDKKPVIFTYPVIDFDIKEKIKKLYNIATEKIRYPLLEEYFQIKIDHFIDLFNLIKNRNNIKFLYNSLNTFGRPQANDIELANKILSISVKDEKNDQTIISGKEIISLFIEQLSRYGVNCKVKLSSNIASIIYYNPTINTFYIKENIKIPLAEAKSLITREVTSRVMSFENARLQPLKIFQLDHPNSIATQEGIGLLNLYLSDQLPYSRFKIIALRTLAVDHMIKEYNFNKTFDYLQNEYKLGKQNALSITIRVYRGGGLTKDYLYLKGLCLVLDKMASNHNFTDLLVGKVDIEDINKLDTLKKLNLFLPPSFIANSFKNPLPKNLGIDQFIQSYQL